MPIHGSCLCRGVRYVIDGPLELAGHCHCSMCRKTHGAAFGTYADVNRSQFHWVEGESLLAQYESSPGNFRYFCSRCGSPLATTVATSADSIAITLGTLDDDPGIRPLAHVFVGSKAVWYEITDELVQFDELPPGITTGRRTD